MHWHTLLTRRSVLRSATLLTAFMAAALTLGRSGQAQPPEKKAPEGKKGPTAKTHEQVVAAGVDYLTKTQSADGTWAKAVHPGITAVVLTGLFRTGKVTADDPLAVKALKHVESLVDAKEGHIAGAEGIRHKFYTTCVNLQALKASGAKRYDPVVKAAAGYLKNGQVGAADSKPSTDPNYGGFGYGPGTRGDLSNTQFAVDALLAAGESKDDPAFKRTLVFVSRCQNLKGEFNDLPWADKINDGSFVYLPGTQGNAADDTPRPGYGSMSFAGLKSLVVCGVTPTDPRYVKALEWVQKNYSVDTNPGRTEGAGGQGYFYYLMTMARCLDLLGIDTVTDAAGKSHNWRAEITNALTLRQQKDGSWTNNTATWMESEPSLDTAYALTTLSYTSPAAKSR